MMKLAVSPTSGKSFVAQIQDQLRREIRHRELRPGDKLPSIRILAEQCGVSVGIVRQAMGTLTTEGYLRSHQGRGVFVAQPDVQRQTIALVLPSLDGEQMPRLIAGAKKGLRDRSARLMVQAAAFDFDEEMDLLSNLDSSLVAGAIIYPPPLSGYVPPLRELQRRGVPYVLVDTLFKELQAEAVTADRVEMGRLGFGHLLELGHRRIGVVDISADAASIQQMRDGADEALQQVGLHYAALPRISVDSRLLDPEHPWENGRRAAEQLLRQHPDLTAAVGMNDHISMGVFQAAKQLGRRIPQDFSVMGLGDLLSFSATEPTITAVDQDHRRMGELAAHRLLKILDGAGDAPVHHKVPPKLKIRGSTAPANPTDKGDRHAT